MCVKEMGVELVSDVAVHERALSHSSVAQENDFKKGWLDDMVSSGEPVQFRTLLIRLKQVMILQ